MNVRFLRSPIFKHSLDSGITFFLYAGYSKDGIGDAMTAHTYTLAANELIVDIQGD